jgi:hypothetical protein
MYEHMLKSVTKSPAEWQRFLRSASYNYKLPFEEQILVYAQRPDATAVLELEKWNKHFDRWVNKNAKGIAVIDRDTTSKRDLKHYFDISDTHEGRFSRAVPVWNAKPEYGQQIIETLEATFGEYWGMDTLDQAITTVVDYAVDDNITDYMRDLRANLAGSSLYDLDDIDMEQAADSLIYNSVAYQLLYRCGYDPETILDPGEFDGIRHFNTPDTLTVLGSAVGDISKMGLREIGSTVLDIEKKNRTFAVSDITKYNEATTDERSSENGTDIHGEKRIPVPRPSTPGRTRSRTWKVRADAPQLPREAQEGDVRGTADERRAEPAPLGNREGGDGEAGIADGGDGESRGSDGEAESGRHDGLDTGDDEHPQQGGGNDTQRPDLQLEQSTGQQNIEGAEVAASASPISPQIIDSILANGGNKENSTLRIAAYFKKDYSDIDNDEFLQREYGIAGKGFILEGNKISTWSNNAGLHFAIGDTVHTPNAITITWEQAAIRVRELLASGSYMHQADLDEVDGFELKELAQKIW